MPPTEADLAMMREALDLFARPRASRPC